MPKDDIIPCIFSDDNTMKCEANHKKKIGKPSDTWRLNRIVIKNEGVNQKIKEEEETKNDMKVSEDETKTVQTLWEAMKAVLRGKYIPIQA